MLAHWFCLCPILIFLFNLCLIPNIILSVRYYLTLTTKERFNVLGAEVDNLEDSKG